MVSRKSLPANVLARYDERIQLGVEQSLARFRDALIPLFSHKGKRPEIIGTGVAVASGDSRLVFTAAHVIRDFSEDTIFVPHAGGWRSLGGTAHKCETPGWKDPEDDRLDAAILELDSDSGANWSGWIGPDDILPGASAGSGDRFVLAGFPRSKLRYNFDRRAVAPRAMPLFSAAIPAEDYRDAHAKPETHIVLGFNREKAIQDSRQVTAPSFRGISGGMMLWSPGIIDPSAVDKTRLAAIFIEWPSPKRILIGTRVDVHLTLIHDRLPALSAMFPQPVSFRRATPRPG